MSNSDPILLYAQIQALRKSMIDLFESYEDNSASWVHKYYLWKDERDALAPYAYSEKLSAHQKAQISRRRFQLQVLMDVAYIQGNLEAIGIPRVIGLYAAAQVEKLAQQSDLSEEQMLSLIDRIMPE